MRGLLAVLLASGMAWGQAAETPKLASVFPPPVPKPSLRPAAPLKVRASSTSQGKNYCPTQTEVNTVRQALRCAVFARRCPEIAILPESVILLVSLSEGEQVKIPGKIHVSFNRSDQRRCRGPVVTRPRRLNPRVNVRFQFGPFRQT